MIDAAIPKAAALVEALSYIQRFHDKVVVVKVGGAETVLTSSGYVNADQVVTVGSTIPGRLRSVLVDKGDHVRRGQLLAQLEDDELRAELAVQKANLGRDTKNLGRQEILARWPEGEPPPRADSLWRCLTRGCERGLLVRTGAPTRRRRFAMAWPRPSRPLDPRAVAKSRM